MADLPLIVVEGDASGPVLELHEPLSFWGGLDPETGCIIDQRHPQVGQCVTNTLLFMPVGRGSSSASSVLAEAIRLGTAPAGLVMLEVDEIIALGAIVADEIYDHTMPIVVVSAEEFARGTQLGVAYLTSVGEIGAVEVGH